MLTEIQGEITEVGLNLAEQIKTVDGDLGALRTDRMEVDQR